MEGRKVEKEGGRKGGMEEGKREGREGERKSEGKEGRRNEIRKERGKKRQAGMQDTGRLGIEKEKGNEME